MDLTELLIDNTNDTQPEIIKKALESRILVINEEISDFCLENYILHILLWNKEDENLPVEKRKKIKIIINSPGGDCITGMSFIDVIKNSKTPIVAIGWGLVASMAYHIFIGCEYRAAYANTVFLQHDGEVTISNSSSKARDTMKFIEVLEDRMKQHVLNHTKMDEEFYAAHYDQEYYMFADGKAKEFGCVDAIIGVDVQLEDLLQ